MKIVNEEGIIDIGDKFLSPCIVVEIIENYFIGKGNGSNYLRNNMVNVEPSPFTLQTPPHDDALALLISFGSAYTWCEDSHLTIYVPCLAHTPELSRAAKRRLE